MTQPFPARPAAKAAFAFQTGRAGFFFPSRRLPRQAGWPGPQPARTSPFGRKRRAQRHILARGGLLPSGRISSFGRKRRAQRYILALGGLLPSGRISPFGRKRRAQCGFVVAASRRHGIITSKPPLTRPRVCAAHAFVPTHRALRTLNRAKPQQVRFC